MLDKKFTNYRLYYNFLNTLAKELTRFYYKKLDRPFGVINKKIKFTLLYDSRNSLNKKIKIEQTRREIN